MLAESAADSLNKCMLLGTALLSLSGMVADAFGAPAGSLTRESLIDLTRAGIKRLNDAYWSPTLSIWLDRPGDDLRGHFEGRRNPPWWPSANAVETLVDFMAATGTSEYDGMIQSLYELQKDHPKRRAALVAELKQRHQWTDADEQTWQRASQKASQEPPPAKAYYRDFQNEYLDDSGWWGITWLKMYDRTDQEKYLATAKVIHAHMAKNWKPEVGGGIVWSEDRDKQRPNSITNGLFILLSARLHQRTHEEAYRQWAERTLGWMRENALYDGTAVVDAPGQKGDYWTYNQGVYLGALVALYQSTGERAYLDEAVKTTGGVLRRSGLVSPSGVIIEKLGTGGDATLFKGILVRYLAHFRDVLNNQGLHSDVAQEIDGCIRASVESLLQHRAETDGLFPAEWHDAAKERTADFNTQVSGLTALVGCFSTAAKQ